MYNDIITKKYTRNKIKMGVARPTHPSNSRVNAKKCFFDTTTTILPIDLT